IVEVVLSIGALTGVALYGPGVWALFSKRQTAFSILFTTIASLLVNLFFKFLAPGLLDIKLNRMEETVLGVTLPLLLLLFFELRYHRKDYRIPSNEDTVGQADPESIAHGNQQSNMAMKTVGYALLGVGIMILILGLISPTGKLSV